MKTILIALLLLGGHAFAAENKSCVKPVNQLELETSVFSCTSDSDCELIEEGCRSCQAPIAVNKNKLDAFTEADESARVDSMCLEECESCDQSLVVVKCVAGKCAAKVDPNKYSKPAEPTAEMTDDGTASERPVASPNAEPPATLAAPVTNPAPVATPAKPSSPSKKLLKPKATQRSVKPAAKSE